MELGLQREPWRQWILLLLWIGIIVAESTSTFSSNNTSRILYSVLAFFEPVRILGHITWERVSVLNANLRILGHLAGYGVLSWLAFCAWRATLPSEDHRPRYLRWMLFALVLTAAVAGLDEFHQSFLPSRSGKVSDVLLDTVGGVAVQCVIVLQSKLRAPAEVSD